MKFHKLILPNGDLQITADKEARAWLSGMLHDYSINQTWPALAGWLAHYYPWVRFTKPEEIGALTSSPILVETANNGAPLATPRVWWIPNYQIENELETLKNTGLLVMSLAPEG